jgi:hypothetical protein
VVEDKDSSVRADAVAKLTDQALLAKLAVEDKDRLIRAAAQNRLRALQAAKPPE